jgi:hypothetical protein
MKVTPASRISKLVMIYSIVDLTGLQNPEHRYIGIIDNCLVNYNRKFGCILRLNEVQVNPVSDFRNHTAEISTRQIIKTF